MSLKDEISNWMRTSITLKLVIIGVLMLLLLIPAFMIQDLIRERSNLQKQVVNDITDKWGANQTITGPVLSIPFKKIAEKNGKLFESVSYAHFLPEKLNIAGVITPEIRKRNIYKVILYNSNLIFKGKFNQPDFKNLNIADENVLWNESFITMGIPDMRGIQQSVSILWNKDSFICNPGVISKDIVNSGITAKIPVNPNDSSYQFTMNLDINGSESISFLPLGKETNVSLKSTWDSPSFSGAFLPQKRDVTTKGFEAEWNILHLNRNYPQQWTSSDNQSIEGSQFGVDLIFKVDHYQKSTRSAKYAVLFLFLTFLVFFMNEVLNKSRIHPIQYLMIGLALLIFYTLLISLSEYLGFNFAYLISSFLTISLITAYSFSILNRKGALVAGGTLVILYGFLFILLQLEDYALMAGSIGLFVILSGLMLASRKINWYSPLNENKA